MCWARVGHALGMCWAHWARIGHALGVLGALLGHALDVHQACAGHWVRIVCALRMHGEHCTGVVHAAVVCSHIASMLFLAQGLVNMRTTPYLALLSFFFH